MGRRKLVIEGYNFFWTTNGFDIAVYPPKELGGTVHFNANKELNRGIGRTDDWESVTPGVVAELIYRDFLKKPMPTPKPKAKPPQRKAPKVPSWTTCPELPRTYLVQARLANGGGTLPLEVHDDPVTARAAAERLLNWTIQGVIKASWKHPDWDLRHLAHGLSKADEADALRRIIDWMKGLRTEGSREIPAYMVETVELPFKMAR
jgi:hypothetical protein